MQLCSQAAALQSSTQGKVWCLSALICLQVRSGRRLGGEDRGRGTEFLSECRMCLMLSQNCVSTVSRLCGCDFWAIQAINQTKPGTCTIIKLIQLTEKLKEKQLCNSVMVEVKVPHCCNSVFFCFFFERLLWQTNPVSFWYEQISLANSSADIMYLDG